MSIKSAIVGIWQLNQMEVIWKEKGVILYPYGPNPLGYLIYTEENFMSANFMRANRPLCSSNDCKNLSIDEKLEIADNHGGYSGRYEIRENKIIHYPEVSWFQNFTKFPLIKEFKLLQNHLTLEEDYFSVAYNKKGIVRATWQKRKLE